jgi:hypothetical protein
MDTVTRDEAAWRPLDEVRVGDLIHPGKGNDVHRLTAIEVVEVVTVRRPSKSIIEVELADGSMAWGGRAMKFWMVKP